MWGMKQMMMQALNKEQHTLRSFNSEREARLASAMPRSQSVSIGVFQTPSAMLPVDSGSLGSFTRRPMHWLKDALEYVDRIDHEAREEGYPPIGHLAKKSAKRVLFIAGSSPIEPHVVRLHGWRDCIVLQVARGSGCTVDSVRQQGQCRLLLVDSRE